MTVRIGTAENDALTGTHGDDVLRGLGGNDRLTGGGGSDRLLGGRGNDVLNMDAEDRIIDGGRGHDTAILSGGGHFTLDNDNFRNVEAIRDIPHADTTVTLDTNVLTHLDGSSLQFALGDGRDEVRILGGDPNDFHKEGDHLVWDDRVTLTFDGVERVTLVSGQDGRSKVITFDDGNDQGHSVGTVDQSANIDQHANASRGATIDQSANIDQQVNADHGGSVSQDASISQSASASGGGHVIQQASISQTATVTDHSNDFFHMA
ncbi:MAG: hypothetical protein H7Z12_02375 [Rhodospirillaceae bacterium]|nr:hypothetical protein [Rhodospirillales bacterium]